MQIEITFGFRNGMDCEFWDMIGEGEFRQLMRFMDFGGD